MELQEQTAAVLEKINRILDKLNKLSELIDKEILDSGEQCAYVPIIETQEETEND